MDFPANTENLELELSWDLRASVGGSTHLKCISKTALPLKMVWHVLHKISIDLAILLVSAEIKENKFHYFLKIDNIGKI